MTNRRKYKRAKSDFYEDLPHKQVKGVDADFHVLKPFGAVCIVHDHDADAHDAVIGRKGIIFGLSDLCITKRLTRISCVILIE